MGRDIETGTEDLPARLEEAVRDLAGTLAALPEAEQRWYDEAECSVARARQAANRHEGRKYIL